MNKKSKRRKHKEIHEGGKENEIRKERKKGRKERKKGRKERKKGRKERKKGKERKKEGEGKKEGKKIKKGRKERKKGRKERRENKKRKKGRKEGRKVGKKERKKERKKETNKKSLTEFRYQMRFDGLPAYLSLNRLLHVNGLVSCSWCYFLQSQPISQKSNSCLTYGRTDRRTDTPSHRDTRTHLKIRGQ